MNVIGPWESVSVSVSESVSESVSLSESVSESVSVSVSLPDISNACISQQPAEEAARRIHIARGTRFHVPFSFMVRPSWTR